MTRLFSTASPVSPAALVTRLRAARMTPKVLRTEVLAGLAVALALIPEAISFSIIAGVDPSVGSLASFTMAVVISVAHLATVTALVDSDGGQVVYTVNGELFFASSNDLVYQFDYANDPDKIIINLASAHVRDASSVAALDAITTKYAARGKTVEIIGLNEHSAKMPGALGGELTGSH